MAERLAARIFLAAIFIISGLGKLGAIAPTQGYMEAFNLPAGGALRHLPDAPPRGPRAAPARVSPFGDPEGRLGEPEDGLAG